MEVHKHLGSGFLEIVYKEALIHELKQNFIDFGKKQATGHLVDGLIAHTSAV